MSVESIDIEMPLYQCRKQVRALKIRTVAIHEDKSATIVPAPIGPSDRQYAPFKSTSGWAERFRGNEYDLGYYVVYRDGYASWSPTKEFEDGYTLI
jgi:hypothetical protein